MEALVHARAIGVSIGLILSLSACLAPANEYVAQDVLKRDEAALLQLPDSVVLRSVGGERADTPTGPSPAFYGRIAGSEGSIDDVWTFFDRQLLALGWRRDESPLLGTTEMRGWGWCKHRMYYRLTIIDPARLAARGIDLPDAGRYRTVYDASLMSSRSACPSTSATP